MGEQEEPFLLVSFPCIAVMQLELHAEHGLQRCKCVREHGGDEVSARAPRPKAPLPNGRQCPTHSLQTFAQSRETAGCRARDLLVNDLDLDWASNLSRRCLKQQGAPTEIELAPADTHHQPVPQMSPARSGPPRAPTRSGPARAPTRPRLEGARPRRPCKTLNRKPKPPDPARPSH